MVAHFGSYGINAFIRFFQKLLGRADTVNVYVFANVIARDFMESPAKIVLAEVKVFCKKIKVDIIPEVFREIIRDFVSMLIVFTVRPGFIESFGAFKVSGHMKQQFHNGKFHGKLIVWFLILIFFLEPVIEIHEVALLFFIKMIYTVVGSEKTGEVKGWKSVFNGLQAIRCDVKNDSVMSEIIFAG